MGWSQLAHRNAVFRQCSPAAYSWQTFTSVQMQPSGWSASMATFRCVEFKAEVLANCFPWQTESFWWICNMPNPCECHSSLILSAEARLADQIPLAAWASSSRPARWHAAEGCGAGRQSCSQSVQPMHMFCTLLSTTRLRSLHMRKEASVISLRDPLCFMVVSTLAALTAMTAPCCARRHCSFLEGLMNK